MCFLVSALMSQGGYWPDSADYSYPRTIIDKDDIATIRNTLSDPFKSNLYQLIYSHALKGIPLGNESDGDRRLRSEIAREAAFVVLMNKKIENDTLVDLLPEEKSTLVSKVLSLLGTLNAEIGFMEGWLFFDEWQFRCRELTHYLIAYDLLKGADILDINFDQSLIRLHLFAGNLHTRVVDKYINPFTGIKNLEFFYYNPNNHGTMNAAALGLAAVVLNDLENADPNYQPENWINTAMWNLDYALWRAEGLIPRLSEPGILAGYAEGPNYFRYGFHTVFPFLRSLWNFLPDGAYEFTYDGVTETIPHPWYDEKYHKLYEWTVKLRMPNGMFPAVHDTPSGFATNITALSGIPEFNIYFPNSINHSIWERAQFLSTNIPYGNQEYPLFQPLPEAGSLIFRSSWNDPSGVYMHLIGKNNIALFGAKAHHQADASSFEIYYNGEILALDEGYTAAGFRDYVMNASDHNLILVNGEGPNPPFGEWIDLNNYVIIERFFDTNHLDYGELDYAWHGAGFTRKVMFHDNRYFVMADFIQSNQMNNYQYQFHGNGLEGGNSMLPEGAFELDMEELGCLVSRNEVHLRTKVIGRGNDQIYSVDTDSIIGGNSKKCHSRMLVHQDNKTNTEYLSVFYPYTNSEILPEIEQIIIDEQTTAFKLNFTNEKHLMFIQPENKWVHISAETGIGSEISANGQMNFIALHADQTFKRAFLEEGDSLFIDEKPYLLAGHKLDIAVEYFGEGIFKGYISDSGTVQLYADSSLIVLSGAIDLITYDPVQQLNTLYFSNATNFELEYGEHPTVASESLSVNAQSGLLTFPNPTPGKVIVSANTHEFKNGNLFVFDTKGRLLKTQPANQGNASSLELDISEFPNGIYILKWEGSNGFKTCQIIKADF